MNEPSASIRALLDRGVESRSQPSREPFVAETELEDYQAFAGGRIGSRPQWTLVFQAVGGAVRGFPYAQFDGIRSSDPSQGFTVTFAEHEVTVEGRNLWQLFTRVCEHRAAAIVEAPPGCGLLTEDDAPIVWSIKYRPRREPPTLPR